MQINIQQSNSTTESVNKIIIDTLYNIFTTNSESDNQNSLLVGRLETAYEYERYVDYLENMFNRFIINISRDQLIWFDDKNVENILITNLNTSDKGGIPTSYKLDLSNINTWFQANTSIVTFNELSLFNNVKTLASNAFKDCTSLEEIDLYNITRINSHALRNTNIKYVNCPNLTYIDSDAFRYCVNLETVESLGTITRLYGNTFYQCYKLSSINLPNTITQIDSCAFQECGLTSIELPNSVTNIYNNVFYKCANLESINFPNSLQGLGISSFNQCTSLTSVILPNSITTIEGGAFKDDSNLESINLQNVQILSSNVFYNCTKLAIDVNMPNLRSISGNAFRNTAIQRVLNLGSITKIDSFQGGGGYQGCFQSCIQLKSVVLPTTCVQLGGNSFAVCSTLESISGCSNIISIGSDALCECKLLSSVDIDFSKLTEIGARAFQNCENLEIQNINCINLTVLGPGAFRNCKKLKNISSLGTITQLTSYYHGGGNRGTFEGCITLETVVLPDTLETIGNAAFAGCTQLRSINIPTSVSALSGWAFSNCSNLYNEILYFKNVRSLKLRTFVSSNINQIYFPLITSLEEGYYSNFTYCNGVFWSDSTSLHVNLLYMKLDSSVSISAGTFVRFGVNNLIIDNPPIENIYTNAFISADIINIYVPDDYVDAYKNANIWSQFSTKYKPISEYPYIIDTYAQYLELRNNGDNNIYLIREYMT